MIRKFNQKGNKLFAEFIHNIKNVSIDSTKLPRDMCEHIYGTERRVCVYCFYHSTPVSHLNVVKL